MYENIAEWLSEGARPYIAMGIIVSAAVILGILAIVSLVMGFWCAWWFLVFAACGVLCGAIIGAAIWVRDECL